LRLLRRIRETSYGNISGESRQLTPEYISVIYIENKNGTATVQRLRIDEEGEFVDRWPEGFFRERSDELF
jgi:predicted ATPase